MLEHNYKIYEENRSWSDAKIPEAIPYIFAALGIVDDGTWSWKLSSFFEDTQKSTDIVLINNKTKKVIMIAFRLRNPEYMDEKGYATQITIREAEFHKIMTGCADYGFYGFIDARTNIVRWIFISLNGFRSVHTRNELSGLHEPDSGIYCSKQKNTAPGDTSFRAYCSSAFLDHDNNLFTEPEDKIIWGHSLGYFEDVSIMPPKYNGAVPGMLPVVTIKDKIDRIDGRV